MNASDKELDHAIEWFEHAGIIGGFLVIVGLVAEVIIAWCHPPYDSFLENWGSVFANFIVAIGVALEVIFSRMGGTRQREVKRRSDIKIAELNERAAAAEERTAKIERLTTWRCISPDQREKIAAAIRNNVTGMSLIVEWQRADAEALVFGQDIVQVFWQAGVDRMNIRSGENGFLGGSGFGAWITGDSESTVTEISAAFGCSDVNLFPWYNPDVSNGRVLATMPGYEPRPDLYIFVCPKPPPIVNF